ncbi:hypothetical protein EA462_07670 [Natrarchaeobius halalkaliphilus]|uniref:DUF7350 domain-containing protein n=1 Tax=Natrarchaeobius halalkaliphilus TaxID=1679091 RepID=A0A3N6MWL9_9EURY|nr:hypothetical protein [Natrarchaeobius halalkaliphilus]RQG89882.1 hypothetical protein EA462_07670 [Natrarchaeobius halalkaliphilus]
MQEHDTIDRRTVIRLGAATGLLAAAGCLELGGNGEDPDEDTGESTEDDDVTVAPELVEVDDPPAAVYLPTHREAMRMLEPIEAGEFVLAPMLSYPHPFWVIAGGGTDDEVERVDPDDGRGVHMMFTLWDAETGIVLPADEGAQIRVFRDGESVGSPRSPWAMISQGMGFHFGDNVPLPEDGTYTVEVTIPSISTTRTGALEGRLTESRTATFEFVYDDEFRHEVVDGVEYFDEEYWGRPGAIGPMDHGEHGDGHGEHGDDGHGEHGDDGHDEHGDDDHDEHGDDGHDEHGDDDHDHHVPYSALPRVEEYPGTLLVGPTSDSVPEETEDLPRSGDAAMLATVFESGFRLADGDERYLLVSPRTPYNRVPLADMSLSVTVERDGEVVGESTLEQTLDGEYDLHYGASIADIEPGDSVTITIESPPQVARHQGYETAFLEMPPVEFVLEDR